MLEKIYGAPQNTPETRYSPAICMGARKAVISGNPVHEHISTSYVERQNLTMRMSMRRFTRLTNGFSKKAENHEHALALYFMYYNFCRIHQTLRVPPAMEAGVSDHVWDIEEILAPSKHVSTHMNVLGNFDNRVTVSRDGNPIPLRDCELLHQESGGFGRAVESDEAHKARVYRSWLVFGVHGKTPASRTCRSLEVWAGNPVAVSPFQAVREQSHPSDCGRQHAHH
jgi:hypothetical protein